MPESDFLFRCYSDPESRRRDEEALRSGAVTRDELQFVNGGYGLFRRSTLVRRSPKGGRPDSDAPVDGS